MYCTNHSEGRRPKYRLQGPYKIVEMRTLQGGHDLAKLVAKAPVLVEVLQDFQHPPRQSSVAIVGKLSRLCHVSTVLASPSQNAA